MCSKGHVNKWLSIYYLFIYGRLINRETKNFQVFPRAISKKYHRHCTESLHYKKPAEINVWTLTLTVWRVNSLPSVIPPSPLTTSPPPSPAGQVCRNNNKTSFSAHPYPLENTCPFVQRQCSKMPFSGESAVWLPEQIHRSSKWSGI